MGEINKLLNIMYWEEKNKKPKVKKEGFEVTLFTWNSKGELEKNQYHFKTLAEARAFVETIQEGDIKIYNTNNQLVHSEKKYAKIKIKNNDDNSYA